MRIESTPERHLTYCSNIHPGETWEEVFGNLQAYVPPLKEALAPSQPFGLGLRLSNQAATELIGPALLAFRAWLDEHDAYVFTINGFPYGGFHRQVVKDQVYAPDWRSRERVTYTLRLAEILADLLSEELEGGISTSPISYKPWLQTEDERSAAFRQGALHLAEVAGDLFRLELKTGRFIHIDIEPEPDCLIENADETITFFEQWLIPLGVPQLVAALNVPPSEAEHALRRHIQVCYDTCHFAVEYEDPADVWRCFEEAGIQVGKVQVSSALKTPVPTDPDARAGLAAQLAPFAESTYLHQVIERMADGTLRRYPDLPDALPHLGTTVADEWRFHYHVPLFTDAYGELRSTQSDIRDTFAVLHEGGACKHLEIETYTWDVLPDDLQLDLGLSIRREYEWVLDAYRAHADSSSMT